MHNSALVPNLIGQTIDDGKLKLTAVLGKGSNGIVFLAEETTYTLSPPHLFAVKCMPKADKGSRQWTLQRQEISNHMAVSHHPNVLTLHGLVEDDLFIYLVLDYCPGGDFYQFLSDGGLTRNNDTLVRRLLVQIIDAITACHTLGIFHRDIKPENILCNEDKTRVFLCDFGLSTRKTYSHNFGAGSSHYMSPECIGNGRNTPYSTRANDVWALGTIITAMISGHNPWMRATLNDNCYRAYMHDSNFLYNTLPISPESNIILQRIFVDAEFRITLPFLRLMVLQAETFYASEERVAKLNKRKARDHSPARSFRKSLGMPGKRKSQERQSTQAHLLQDPTIDLEKQPLEIVDITSVPRPQPTNPDDSGTLSGGDSIGPTTPCMYPIQESMSPLPEYDLKASDVDVLPTRHLVADRKQRDSSSAGFMRRMVERWYVC